MSVFIATLPPELWRECIRWATLPPSGRLPLDDSLTALDLCPVGMPHDFYRLLYPETAYAFEQSRIYPTKRALMLVSRAWTELAVEFMYESLVVNYFGVGRPEQVLAALEGSAGLVLKKWVKRVDIFRCPRPPQKNSVCERLARVGLPNLRMQNMVNNRDTEVVPLQNSLSEQPLHLIEACGSPVLDRLTSRAFGSLRCLTLWMVEPLVTPLHLPSSLRRLTIIPCKTAYLRVQNIFSTRDSFTLPNLTHLALHHRNRSPDRLVRSMEIINHIGPQLRHLTLTVNVGGQDWRNGDDLCTILCVCTQLRELVIPSPLATWKAEPGDYGHPTLQTLGVPITWKEDFESCIGIFSRRGAFPKLGVIRLVSQHGDTAPWMEPYDLHLLGHGIRLEDCCGRILAPASVLDDQNSGCVDTVPL